MAQTINTNMFSLNAQRNLNTSGASLATSMQRLSSGLRVNNSKDDAAGMAIADRMNSQIRGMTVAMRNANDAISLAQTAEGSIANVGDAMQRMRELAVQSANATNTTTDRGNLDSEFQQLVDEVDRLIAGSKFNGQNVLNAATAWKFQIGADAGGTNELTVTSVDLTAVNTAIGALDITSAANATAALTAIDTQLGTVTTARATWGAVQNRFDSVISNLQVTNENLTAARGRIMDADFAVETANLSRSQILQQAGTAMLAQANQIPQQVLRLIQ